MLLHFREMPLPPRSAPLPVGTGRRPGGSRPPVGSAGSYGLMSQSYMDVAAVAPEQVRRRETEGAGRCDPFFFFLAARGFVLLALSPLARPLSHATHDPHATTQPIISPRYKGGGGEEEEDEEDAGATATSREAADAAADDALAERAAAALNLATSAPAPPAPAPAAAAAPPVAHPPRAPRMPPLGAARQCHENEVAEVVIVCEPEGTSLMMGGLHPR